MAPMKRQRSIHDDGEFDLIEVESASARLQPASRKKQRASSNQVYSEGSEQNTDDESFLEQATQFINTQQTKEKPHNAPADNGVIESVTCVNFMCHKHFDVKLGPLINFITGHNGSGKSAILTAITICLGGKATSTNRGGSLKSFIMNGEDYAQLSVKLKNTSDTAYQPELYGDSIIVERHFTRSGASGFKLKSASGRVISTRKGDLDDICDYFALQIDNPMNVLTQDMARQFLNNSTPSDKYKFFMKGTQLEHLDGDYNIVEHNLEAIDADLWKKAQDVEVFREEAKKAGDLHKLSQRNDTLRENLQRTLNMLAWSQVEEQESILASKEKRVPRELENVHRLESQFESLSEGYRQSDEANDVAIRHIAEAKNELMPLQEEKDKVKEEHDRQKAEQAEIQTQQRTISSELRASEKRVAEQEKNIEEETQRISNADGGIHAERRKEIEEKKLEAQEAKDRVKAHEVNLPSLEESRRRADREYQESQIPIKEKRIEVESAEGRLGQLTRDRGQQQNAYPAAMPRLLRSIQDDDGFLEKPVGPIGKHVRLLKPMWSSILEKSLGSALDSFIVTSKSDQSRLLGHMQRSKCVSPILIGNHNPIDTTGHEPDPEFDTFLRVLEIDNDLARKQLIIGQAIDQTILIANRGEAVAKVNAARLRNVKQCFAQNVEPGTGLRLAYGLGGGLSENFIPRFQGTPRMKTDIEYQIRAQEEVIKNLKTEFNRLEQVSFEKRSHLKTCEQAIGRHKKDTGPLRIEAQRAQSVVEGLQDALDNDSVEEGRLEYLKNELREMQEDKATHESSYQDCVNARDEVYRNLKATRDQMLEIDKSIKEAEARVMKAEAKANQRTIQREQALKEKNDAESTWMAAKQDYEALLQECERVRVHVDEFTRQASGVCARVPIEDGQNFDSLQIRHKKLRDDLIRAEQRLGGSREQIAKAAADAQEAFLKAKREVDNADQLIQLLKSTLLSRKDRWRRFQKYITSRARIQFFYQLSERGFRGKLLANHKEKKLDLQVEPDETRTQAKGRSTHGLSGGEKSFSTICLLLSMWEAMGAPVRCLDEFDVFMDSVNRDISMEMFVRFARDSMGKQFILITPQSMGKVDIHAPDINVIKIRDPVRSGQQRLDFPPAS